MREIIKPFVCLNKTPLRVRNDDEHHKQDNVMMNK